MLQTNGSDQYNSLIQDSEEKIASGTLGGLDYQQSISLHHQCHQRIDWLDWIIYSPLACIIGVISTKTANSALDGPEYL